MPISAGSAKSLNTPVSPGVQLLSCKCLLMPIEWLHFLFVRHNNKEVSGDGRKQICQGNRGKLVGQCQAECSLIPEQGYMTLFSDGVNVPTRIRSHQMTCAVSSYPEPTSSHILNISSAHSVVSDNPKSMPSASRSSPRELSNTIVSPAVL